MTPDEVRANMNKLVKLTAPGTKRGWKYGKITEFDPDKNTAWGKGSIVITYPLQEDQYHQRFRTFRMCITQTDLYQGNNSRKRKKNGVKERKRTRKTKESEQQSKKSNGDDTPKRKRTRKSQEEPVRERKRRRNNVETKGKRKRSRS